MKPALSCEGNDGGWVTARGIECKTAGAVLLARPSLEVKGVAPLAYLGSLPALRAKVLHDGQVMASTACDGRLEGAAKPKEIRYAFSCDLSGLTSPAPMVTVELQFDRYFVPKDLRLNADTRKLVTTWPEISVSVAPTVPTPSEKPRPQVAPAGVRVK